MLLLDKTLLKLSKGSFGWILAIVLVRLITLISMTQFASVIGTSLGAMLEPSFDPSSLGASIQSAFLISALLLAARLIQGELEYRCSASARTHMRQEIFEKTMALDAGRIEKIGPVSAVTAGVDAVEHMQTYVCEYLPSLLFSVIAPVYLFFQIAPYSLSIAWIWLLVSLILLPLHNVFRFRIEHLRKKYWHSVDDMTGYFLDSVRGLSTLKLFGRDREHQTVLKGKAEQLSTDINAFMKINFTSFLVTEAILSAAVIAAIALSLKDGLNPGEDLTILLFSYSYFASMRELMSATHDALTAVSAASKVEEILNTDVSRQYDPSLPEDDEHFNGISLKDVVFGYPGRQPALKDVSLKFAKGKVSAIVGLSGSGKSTIGSLVMRFLDPQKGHLYLEGKDYASMKPEEVRERITMVPQTVSIFNGTIRDNLLLADPHASDERLKEVLGQVHLEDFANDLDRSTGDNGSALSGGQKQKLGIARALLSDCDYIVLDEATSSVDPQSEKEIWETIEALSASKTLIIISHRLSSIRNADAIFVLNHGKIEECGRHEDLMNHEGFYARLVKEQTRLEEEGVQA
jgi:ATP-binding cassette subfamily C protein